MRERGRGRGALSVGHPWLLRPALDDTHSARPCCAMGTHCGVWELGHRGGTAAGLLQSPFTPATGWSPGRVGSASHPALRSHMGTQALWPAFRFCCPGRVLFQCILHVAARRISSPSPAQHPSRSPSPQDEARSLRLAFPDLWLGSWAALPVVSSCTHTATLPQLSSFP